MKTSLTIAGFDPTGGAGIQADLKVFHALGVYGLSVVSALTAQNTRGVSSIKPVSELFVKKQLTVLLSDLQPDATKIGMLYNNSNVDMVVKIIKKNALKNIVVDPVFRSSSGKSLAEKNTPIAIRKNLFPLCAVVTPNIHEASVLTGIRIKNKADMEKAAVHLRKYGPENIIITGGHLEKIALDILYDGDFHYLKSKKRDGEYHGTGCMFSAALTALLAQGNSVLDAARKAKDFTNKAFSRSFDIGKGMKLLNF
jgi:hydroxymethylpyrimidine/phosphomethylpyrimidine kinase